MSGLMDEELQEGHSVLPPSPHLPWPTLFLGALVPQARQLIKPNLYMSMNHTQSPPPVHICRTTSFLISAQEHNKSDATFFIDEKMEAINIAVHMTR